MRDFGKMTDEELGKELDAFYDFVRAMGYGYLTEDGLVYFNGLRGEFVVRKDVRDQEQGVRIPPGQSVSSVLNPRI